MSDKDEGDGDNPTGAGLGGQNWELAKLVGNYERFTQDVDQKLSRIEDKLEEGAVTFGKIKTTIASKTVEINNLENRVEDLENKGGDLTKRRRLQIDGTTLAAIVLTLKEVVTAILGALK